MSCVHQRPSISYQSFEEWMLRVSESMESDPAVYNQYVMHIVINIEPDLLDVISLIMVSFATHFPPPKTKNGP